MMRQVIMIGLRATKNWFEEVLKLRTYWKIGQDLTAGYIYIR